MSADPIKIGDKVLSKPTTIAFHCGDKSGVVEKVDGSIFMVRMDQSGLLVPFRHDSILRTELAPHCDTTSALAEFFHRTRWSIDELAQLGPVLQMDAENLKAAHSLGDIELTAKCTEELARHVLQALKLIEPLIGQLENHGPLRAAFDTVNNYWRR